MRRFFVLLAGLVFVALPSAVLAQSSVASYQQQLQAQLDSINAQIADQQALLTTAQGQHQTLQSQINALNAEIKKTQLQIQAINLTIAQLQGGIGTDNRTLSALSTQLSAEQESLAQIMRQTQMIDNYSAVEVALSSQNVSAFFADLDAFAAIKSSMADSFDHIHKTSASTEAEKASLEAKLTEEQQLASEVKIAKLAVQQQQAQKQALLTATKGIEANFQALIAKNQKTASQIRAELFALAGGGGQIPLPTAIALAKQAGAATGVRPALILGILKQETNLGANVGQCLLTNVPNKGDGKGKNTSTVFRGVMKPTRDVDPFMTITASLGFDPFAMPVSCPPSYGYGGAMGPGQFIPSTWVLYQNRIAKLAGHVGQPANPWDNLDAFTAIALLMADNGAALQTPSAERIAALKYFAGGNWSKAAYAFYGDGVLDFAGDFQQDIDQLSGS